MMTTEATYLLEVTADRDPAPLLPLTGGPVSDLIRMELLHNLLSAQYVIADMMNCIRSFPDDAQAVDNIAGALAARCERVSTLLTRFQNTRECRGQA